MNYTWNYATLAETQELVDLSVRYRYEVDDIFKIDLNIFAHNIVLAIVNQYYTGRSDLIATCRNEQGQLLAYTWVKAGERSMWSNEEIAAARMAHVDPNLSARQRILLIKDMLTIWERFAQIAGIPLISSNTIRQEQTAFLKLHKQAGYIVRGSLAYRHVDLSIKPERLFD